MPNKIKEFTDLVNGIDDTELLEVANGLMIDLATIANMKERLKMLEDGLVTEERAVFHFFTLELDDEEVGLCADAVKGRLRVLKEKEERQNLGKEPKDDEEAVEAEVEES